METQLYIKLSDEFIKVVGPEVASQLLKNSRTGANCSKSYIYLLCQLLNKDGTRKLESFKTDAGIVVTARSIKSFNRRAEASRRKKA